VVFGFVFLFLLFFHGDNGNNTEAFTLESESSPFKLPPLPNIFMGFANKKNKLNLVQFSPQAVLSLQRGSEQCHVSGLSRHAPVLFQLTSKWDGNSR